MQRSEASVQAAARIAASAQGWRVFRNNVGAMQALDGRLVRYGLANESAAQNKRIKSGDLIGLRPLLIGPQHVGMTIGQFVSIECKAPDYRHDERYRAQVAWRDFVLRYGGHALILTDEGAVR